MINLGSTRNSNELHYEVHILNFNEMIYGQALNVKVCFYLREEIAFPSFNDLISQINRDIDSVVNRFHLIKTH
ncbi:riboflavin kinase [Alkalihalobacterium alkalinitrilicum]|uniref:riboflavin kinase n=1 Tax=Alkalihalobacterium alkalinitrilicum TaxID=427920 RepID=UPI001C573F5D